MSDWTELPGFPRTYPSQCAPWGSSVRFVNGVRDLKNGKTVTLSGAKAFLQRLEIDLIQGRAAAPDIPTLLLKIFDANARHIDQVEWCRVRGDELDLSLRVYGTRGSQRLHLDLRGPIGRHADDPLPAHATGKNTPTRTKQPALHTAPILPAFTLPPPAAPILLRPLTPGAGPSYGDPIAHDLDGRVHVVVRLADGDAWACIDPTGAVTISPLTTRDVLRETDPGACTRAMLASLHGTATGLVRIDHYENSAGMQERVHHAGRCRTARSFLANHVWTLGMFDDWFLRVIVHDKKATLLGVHLATGKRSRVALPDGDDLRGAAVDRTPAGDRLRLLGAEVERHLDLRADKTLTSEPRTTTPHGLTGLVQPVPDDGWLVAEARTLRLVRPDRTTRELFTVPPSFTAPNYAPWGYPITTRIGHTDDPVWLTRLDFGADDGPRCTGVLVFTRDGSIRGEALVDADATLHLGPAAIPLGDGHACGYTAGPTGDIAAVLALKDALTLVWSSPA